MYTVIFLSCFIYEQLLYAIYYTQQLLHFELEFLLRVQPQTTGWGTDLTHSKTMKKATMSALSINMEIYLFFLVDQQSTTYKTHISRLQTNRCLQTESISAVFKILIRRCMVTEIWRYEYRYSWPCIDIVARVQQWTALNLNTRTPFKMFNNV